MPTDDPLDELASSVSDGTRIDWDRVEADPGHEAELKGLRAMERIAEFSRGLQRPAAGFAGAPSPASVTTGAERAERWGDLTLLECIGAGSNGEVWRAWDATLQREVALKFLQNRSMEASRAAREVLLNESRALARVRHRGVVTVYGIAEHDGRPGMWMEFLRGPTLAAEIERQGALPVSEVARIGLDLCAALEAVDRAGLVHRDLKPANIVLEDDGRVVLTDFGLGWLRAGSQEPTPRGWGTPVFMSPELMDGEAPTHRSDLYALGVTLRWALTGRAPFHAKDWEALRSEAGRGPATSLAAERADVPRGLVQAIEWAMTPRPDGRVLSAARLASLIRAAVGGDPGVASIAVLPFVDRNPGGEEEYFSDGLADEVRGLLAKIRDLKVAARSSSVQFKGARDDLATIGAKLNVATLLEGTVRKYANRVRIAVQLSRAADGHNLWAETYDRAMNDIFAVQDDIAQQVVAELRQTFLGQEVDSKARGEVKVEVAQAAKGRSTSPEALRLCLQARHFGERGNRDELAKGYEYLDKALKLDPAYASAWALLGRMHMREADMGWVAAEAGHNTGREFVSRALTLEPDLPEGHAALGWSRMVIDWDWTGADTAFRRALELMPGNTVVLCYASAMASNLGHLDDALDFARRAVDQDPLSSFPYITVGLTLTRMDRFAEAEVAFHNAIALSPQRATVRAHLALAMNEQGRRDEALAEAAQEPERWARLWALAIIQHSASRRKEADDTLRELIETEGETAAYQIASVFALLGDRDAAFQWLENARALRDTGVAETKSNPHFRPLHRDPRWTAFLAKIGFRE